MIKMRLLSLLLILVTTATFAQVNLDAKSDYNWVFGHIDL